MAKDFVPQAESDLSVWLKLLKDSINKYGADLSLDATDISRARQLCDEYIAQIQSTFELKAKVQSEQKKKLEMRNTHLKPLRGFINKMKANPAYNKGTGAALRLLSHKQETDSKTYKLKLKAIRVGDSIQVKFKKAGIEGVKLSVQINNGEWKSLGVRLYSPIHYKPQGFPQGTPLHCNLMGVAIKKDEDFGSWSDMVSVLCMMP